MSTRLEVIQKFIGKPVKDIYGRYVGVAVGLSFDAYGDVVSIGVNQGENGLVDYSNSQILTDKETLVLIPAWKRQADGFFKENSVVQQRFNALDELLKTSEIPQTAYEDLSKSYKESIARLSETRQMLNEKLKSKVSYLEDYVKRLQAYLADIKVQYKTNEIDEDTFQGASGCILAELSFAETERKEIFQTMESLSL